MPQGPQLSSLPKKKTSTILPRTPSPSLNKLPSSKPIIHTSIPPSREHCGSYPHCHPPHHPHSTLQHPFHPTHHPHPTLQHTSHPPYHPYPPHNFTSTFPTLVHHSIPPHSLPSTQPRRRHPFTDFIANTPSLPNGNLSH